MVVRPIGPWLTWWSVRLQKREVMGSKPIGPKSWSSRKPCNHTNFKPVIATIAQLVRASVL